MTTQKSTASRVVRVIKVTMLAAAGLLAFGIASAETITTPRSQITFQVGKLHGDRMMVANPDDRLTWVYHDRRLRAYDQQGNRIVDRIHLTLPRGQVPVALLANGQALWLAVDRQLIKFDLDGQIILQKYFSKGIHGLTYDVKSAQLMVATPKQVFILDHEGEEIDRIRMTLPYIA